jgi:TRAP-type C4-dicarboxylate transport system substrate-binding protein
MMITRRRLFAVSASALAMPALLRPAHGQTPQVRLRLHHFLPPVTSGQVNFLAPWAQRVQQESGGRIKIDIFPAMQLGGSPPQLFDQARDGVVDLVWTLPGYTPGRFPISETLELPFVAHRKAVVNSRAFQQFAEASMQDEFKDVHPICFWAHDQGLIHANKPVRTLEDLKGLKLRFPTRLAGEALRALGATAIGMPVPQVPESLAQHVIDGTVLPWEVVPSIKVHELVKNHTEIPGSPTLYTATFVLVMNKAKYEGLPADLKQVIDAHSGMVAATMAGKVWDEQAIAVSAMVRSRGNTIVTLAEDEAARWRQGTLPVVENWLRTTKERGIDGRKLLESLQAAIKKHENAA